MYYLHPYSLKNGSHFKKIRLSFLDINMDIKNLFECWKPIWFVGADGDIVPIAAWLVMQIFGVKSLQKIVIQFPKR